MSMNLPLMPSLSSVQPEPRPVKTSTRPPLIGRRRWLALAGAAAVMPSGGCAPTADGFPVDPAPVADLLGQGGAVGFGIWRGGRRIAGRGLDERLGSLSITKGFASLAALRGVAGGWLDIDGPLTDCLPEWRRHPAKSRITLRMLVNQTAGFPAGAPQLYRGSPMDKGRVAIGLPLVDPPGSRFRYGPASWEVLAEVMRRRLRDRGADLGGFLHETMAAIGLTSPGWRHDRAGTPYLSTGAEFSVRELGRLGECISSLVRGSDTAGVRATDFQELARPTPPNPMVSAGIWWNRQAAAPGARGVEPEEMLGDARAPAFWQTACLQPSADPGWLALVGSGGKRVYVLPDRRIVLVRLARAPGWRDGGLLRAVTV